MAPAENVTELSLVGLGDMVEATDARIMSTRMSTLQLQHVLLNPVWRESYIKQLLISLPPPSPVRSPPLKAPHAQERGYHRTVQQMIQPPGFESREASNEQNRGRIPSTEPSNMQPTPTRNAHESHRNLNQHSMLPESVHPHLHANPNPFRKLTNS
jgi:hypothetical protein